MPPRKRTTKKAAAAVEPEVESTYEGPKWPLLKREYLSTRSLAADSQYAGPVVRDLRARLGLDAAGVFDGEVRDAVLAFQRGAGLPETGVVTSADWEALHTEPAASDGE
jgi:peptidoglycan hydrolase-like protein with peptidoglycan-binding domain